MEDREKESTKVLVAVEHKNPFKKLISSYKIDLVNLECIFP
jgi:hypothetical protein